MKSTKKEQKNTNAADLVEKMDRIDKHKERNHALIAYMAYMTTSDDMLLAADGTWVYL